MNIVILTGRLTKEPELRKTPNGDSVLQNTIAVNRPFKNANGTYDADFIVITMYKQTADYIKQYACKGALIEVVGRWQHRSYTDNLGNTKYVDECVVDRASVLSTPQQVQETQPQPQAPTPAQRSTPTPQYQKQETADPFASSNSEEEYHVDENGTYYINEFGQKEYLGF